MMDPLQHELYEDARIRVKQKKKLFFHFVVFILGSIFLYIANEYLVQDTTVKWYLWATSIWALIFVLHAINVLIVNRFMNKKWERTQIDKLMEKQLKKREELERQVEKQFPTSNPSSSDTQI